MGIPKLRFFFVVNFFYVSFMWGQFSKNWSYLIDVDKFSQLPKGQSETLQGQNRVEFNF